MTSLKDHDNEWSEVTRERGSSEHSDQQQYSSTPPRPSYSPVTPTIQPSFLAPLSNRQQPPPAAAVQQQHSDVEWIDVPPAEPVSLEENPDAIALRATISLLQMQKQQSLKDIRDLEKMKTAALKDPQAFLNDLRDGKLSGTGIQNLSRPTMNGSDVNNDEDHVKKEETEDDTATSDDDELPVNGATMGSSISPFGSLPQPQDIVRAPPINWAKYHVVGEPFDRIHEQQRLRPTATSTPARVFDGSGLMTSLGDSRPGYYDQIGQSRSEYVNAAPYDPLYDRLSPSGEGVEARVRGGSVNG
ncbi:hypothetical protein UCRPC4_g06901 [Phaeomoniella chlamydospora]|uniref:Uncharacterized protein n=1 Tax=Phaeomoniella chlamydospora TaxID=158046 RepID=A0A0G2DUP5_PHACM|nr:hypothetical protein UCRPC4_g06901 [Phaeomoniella chlamydospora]